MNGEQTSKVDTNGINVPDTVQNPQTLFEKTNSAAERLENANKKTEELLQRQEALYANNILGGNSGGHVNVPVVSPEEAKINSAVEFFKGSSLADVIKKHGKD